MRSAETIGGPAAPGGRTTLRERLLAWRNATLANPAFQDWAAAFPLTRPIAKRRSRELFDLCAGFVYSQTLAACVELDLFEHLRRGPLSVEAVARRTGLPREGAERLLRAAAALKLAERLPNGRYGLGPQGAALLGNPSVFAMIRHHRHLYADLAAPAALLEGRSRDTQLARYWGYAGAPDPASSLNREDAADYTRLMADTQAFIAREVMRAYPVRRHGTLMDVGGGAGAFLVEAAKTAPDLSLVLVDLPAVAPTAQAAFDAAGVQDRARIVGLDAFSEPLPEGADLISFVRVLHDHDDGAVLRVLRAAREALAPGGRVLVAEPMAGTPGAEAMGDAYFGLYLWAMGAGRPRTRDELTDLLRAAGFTSVKARRTRQSLFASVLIAR